MRPLSGLNCHDQLRSQLSRGDSSRTLQFGALTLLSDLINRPINGPFTVEWEYNERWEFVQCKGVLK